VARGNAAAAAIAIGKNVSNGVKMNESEGKSAAENINVGRKHHRQREEITGERRRNGNGVKSAKSGGENNQWRQRGKSGVDQRQKHQKQKRRGENGEKALKKMTLAKIIGVKINGGGGET
jgi:hypothetical protein